MNVHYVMFPTKDLTHIMHNNRCVVLNHYISTSINIIYGDFLFIKKEPSHRLKMTAHIFSIQ